jgi:hypothetical protein
VRESEKIHERDRGEEGGRGRAREREGGRRKEESARAREKFDMGQSLH